MWVRIEDGMPHHPKLVAAGPQAFALDVAAICYATKFDTEGFIADGALNAVLPGLAQARRHAKKLEEIGRWVRDETRSGWVVHDYDDYQFTAAERSDIANAKTAKSVLANHKRWHERRGVTSPECPHCFPDASPKESHGDTSGIPPRNPKPIPNHPTEQDKTRQDLDLGLVATGLGSGTEAEDSPDGTNGESNKAERHRLAHVRQERPDPENCELCARAEVLGR